MALALTALSCVVYLVVMNSNLQRWRKAAQNRPRPGISELASRIRSRLRSQAEPEKARAGQAFFKEPVRLFGVSSADTRSLAMEMYGQVRKFWSWREAAELAGRLLPDPHLEVKAVAIILLGRFINSAPPSLLHKAKFWLAAGYCDNWASVDTLCPEVISPLLARFPQLLKRVENWTSSRNRWLVRASAVALIPLARRGEELRRAYATSRRLFAVEDDLIHKANGWLLREAGKTDMQRLEEFLRALGPAIPRTTLRYAIERYPADKRRQILRETKGSSGRR